MPAYSANIDDEIPAIWLEVIQVLVDLIELFVINEFRHCNWVPA
jgi:hypothetical protein